MPESIRLLGFNNQPELVCCCTCAGRHDGHGFSRRGGSGEQGENRQNKGSKSSLRPPVRPSARLSLLHSLSGGKHKNKNRLSMLKTKIEIPNVWNWGFLHSYKSKCFKQLYLISNYYKWTGLEPLHRNPQPGRPLVLHTVQKLIFTLPSQCPVGKQDFRW